MTQAQPRENRRNYYRLLQVQPDAPAAVIKASYRTMMQTLKMHPDLGGDVWDAALLNEAYAILSDPIKRSSYDQKLLQQYIGNKADFHAQQRIRHYCAFCKTPYEEKLHQDCAECRSPLKPAAKASDASSRRELERLPMQAKLHYYLHWPQPEPFLGMLHDVSPKGLGFLSHYPIRPEQIIKISVYLLQAIARVVRCVPEPTHPNVYRIGVAFITVEFMQQRGNFVHYQI